MSLLSNLWSGTTRTLTHTQVQLYSVDPNPDTWQPEFAYALRQHVEQWERGTIPDTIFLPEWGQSWVLVPQRTQLHKGPPHKWIRLPARGGPWVAIATGPRGLWALAKSGHVKALGRAPTLGSLSEPSAPAVSIAAMHKLPGYWILLQDGRVHAFGRAMRFEQKVTPHGNACKIRACPLGHGYWILYTSGRIEALGDAQHYGMGIPAGTKARNLIPTPDGKGYWIVCDDLQMMAYGNAQSWSHISPF